MCVNKKLTTTTNGKKVVCHGYSNKEKNTCLIIFWKDD